MAKLQQFEIEIDKLTRSVENALSGESFKTTVMQVTETDIRKLKKSDWLFDWKTEAGTTGNSIFKLVIIDDTEIIQGLISLQNRADHIFMSLIESSRANRGVAKEYIGIPGNLVAFACGLSFENGYGGYVSFESKTVLIEHYRDTLGAHVLFGNIMAIDTAAAAKLVNQYFPEKTVILSRDKRIKKY